MNVDTMLTIERLRTSPAEVSDQLDRLDANETYRAVLRIQNELHIGETIRYLEGNPKWSKSKNVLDLGCGPGDLIAHLSHRFADKSYTGVDLNESFIAAALEQMKGATHRAFHHADLYDFAIGKYDFVILRAVLQHLSDPDRLMMHLPVLLDDGAAVLFLETTKENFVVSDPPITTFAEFYIRNESAQKEHTGSRNCIAELEGQLGKHGFKAVENDSPMIPVTGAENRIKAVQYIILGCAIAKKLMSIHVDFESLFVDLIHWHEAKDSWMNLKSLRMLIERA